MNLLCRSTKRPSENISGTLHLWPESLSEPLEFSDGPGLVELPAQVPGLAVSRKNGKSTLAYLVNAAAADLRLRILGAPDLAPPYARKPKWLNGLWWDGEFWFDADAAQRAIGFIEDCVCQFEGEWAGKNLHLTAWEVDVVAATFGWKSRDGLRRFRIVYVEVPRKNGKSTLAYAIALYLLFADGETGAQVYAAAADREQAGIVFGGAKKAIEGSPLLLRRCEVYKRHINVLTTNSIFRVLSSDVATKHGLSPHGVIFDELHTQPNRNLWDVLLTGRGARRQPLVFAITTAGYDQNSICYQQHKLAELSQAGEGKEDFLGVIFAAGPEDDWKDPAVWRKANPNLGVTFTEDYLAAECQTAQLSPAYENTFRQLYLNQWTQQKTRWMPIDRWDACAAPAIHKPTIEGRPGCVGLDLSSSLDLTAAIGVFPIWLKDLEHFTCEELLVSPSLVGEWAEVEGAPAAVARETAAEAASEVQEPRGYLLEAKFWCPEEGIRQRAKRDRVPYDVWARQGWITPTEGEIIDYDVIRRDIKDWGEISNLKEIAVDRWNATQLITQLAGDGFVVFPFGQGYQSMSAPTKRLLELVLAKQIFHSGNPVLRWMAGNMVVRKDPAGNLKPDKEKAKEKIDGMVALVMALARAMMMADDELAIGASAVPGVYVL